MPFQLFCTLFISFIYLFSHPNHKRVICEFVMYGSSEMVRSQEARDKSVTLGRISCACIWIQFLSNTYCLIFGSKSFIGGAVYVFISCKACDRGSLPSPHESCAHDFNKPSSAASQLGGSAHWITTPLLQHSITSDSSLERSSWFDKFLLK